MIDLVLSHPNQIVQGLKTVDVYHVNGQGIRINLDTLEFQTFLEASKASR